MTQAMLPSPVCGPIQPLPDAVPAAALGESPFWHPLEQCLYWLDIPGRLLHRYQPQTQPQTQRHSSWPLASEPGCCAPLLQGGLLLAMRDGLWHFDTDSGTRSRVAAPPYDPTRQRFNDGKADAQGRFWVGTIDDARQPDAALYCHVPGDGLQRVLGTITNCNGLATSPDGRTLYCADTKAHQLMAFDLEPATGQLSRQRVLRQFEPRVGEQPLSAYGGRPDGAAVDSEGAYWVAMYEGQRLLRLAPDGRTLAELALPVRCPTMPCFGGDDLRTLYISTARHGRPAAELAAQPWAGRVLSVQVSVPGLPVHLAQL